MKVSIIVVGHNVCKLLRKSLTAVREATTNINSEIILVDINSDDETVKTVMKEFPDVRITTSEYTKGFSKGINQGIRLAKGEYVLLLKPDVIVQKDSIKKSIDFMDRHLLGGGMGVRVLDNEGNYLKTSKKILPNTWAVFFKLTGLLKQFPKSRLNMDTNAYNDDEFDTAETDVLNSKYMLLRRSSIDSIGLFDERFLHYGSNIDLSYRMRLAGFKNYYFPKTYVIDLQNNKIPRFSAQHLKSFYGAMFIFAIKYLFSLPALHVKPMQELYPAYELKG